ncbi:MAG: GNAT family N-acetyltransferase [Clostridiales bacterium]|nr:GNAT family N-acetyltransferase [Clostridiales bacterium]
MIRRAEIKDLDKIIDLLFEVALVHHEGRPDIFKKARKYTDDEIISIINDDKTPLLVCVDEFDEVLGYAFCVIEEKGSLLLQKFKTLYIDDLCVFKNLRGKGFGKELIEGVKSLAKEEKCYNITLNVWALNENAKKFYEKLGFSVQKIGMEVIL